MVENKCEEYEASLAMFPRGSGVIILQILELKMVRMALALIHFGTRCQIDCVTLASLMRNLVH